jgi:hypothetical protein
MSPKLLVPGLAMAALALAACGSSSSSTSGSAAGAKHAKSKTGVHGHTYHVTLSGKAETPPGAPNGSGAAVIALHGSTLKVCWRFSHLHGFTSATVSHIHRGKSGTAGPIVVPRSTTGKFHHKGCVPSSAAELKAIGRDPAGYYVNIHSKQYPGGAVRAQL